MLVTILGSIAGAGLLGFLIDKFDTANKVGTFCYKASFKVAQKLTIWANAITFGLWNKTLEPLLERAIAQGCKGFHDGLNSDEAKGK